MPIHQLALPHVLDPPLVLYFPYITCSGALTNMFKLTHIYYLPVEVVSNITLVVTDAVSGVDICSMVLDTIVINIKHNQLAKLFAYRLI